MGAVDSAPQLGERSTPSAGRDRGSPARLGDDILREDSQSQGQDESGGGRRKHPDRWRPALHVTAPRGWLNDPCAPGYDATHDVYHVGFQWNPKSTEWADISWGCALSRDLVSWAVSDNPSLTPTAEHDPCGVFTGCMAPAALEPGTLAAFYTSVSHLPIHHSLPYKRGAEALHMATSSDSGRSWRRFAENPVLPGPPAHLEVTGWRDPYVSPWPSLSAARGQPADTVYGIVSGGIRGRGPTVFLYQLNPHRMGVWRFISPLVSVPAHLPLDFGKNWEVANFVSLPGPDPSDVHDFLILSVEGRLPNVLSRGHTQFRVDHAQMWMCGRLRQEADGQAIAMDYQYGGRLDHGAYYAGNSFWDPKANRQVIIGWLVEEDLTPGLRRHQGWGGMLSLPRVLRVQTLRWVVGTVSSRSLNSIASVGLKRENDDVAYAVTTLGATPDERLANLRSRPRVLTPEDFERGSELSLPRGSVAWEMDMAFDIGASVRRVGIVIDHNSPDAGIHKPSRTTIFFDRHAEALTIVRRESTSAPGVNVSDEVAPHPLFVFCAGEGGAGGQLRREKLLLRVFFDASAIEVFANDRTALSTRVYPDTGRCFRIKPFVERTGSEPGDGRLEHCTYWDLSSPSSRP
ncbi:related to Sucrose-6-phosphate hydrolase [Cephalotrichum gorgonifer]|uniref:Related to Sucrose-6-phosphate hydrolase n=1 Tax=Cephalotrichum gorgonifer TaxID=2041049 RepID=A0AAE8N340_9PEZI|nr:related to Sucrose-6-phosphate hydrolase [Cephalotrichum gorgonifer]